MGGSTQRDRNLRTSFHPSPGLDLNLSAFFFQGPFFPPSFRLQEIVFRACMLPLLYQASSSPSSLDSPRAIPFVKLIFLSPLFFGLAHAHHALQRVREGLPVGDEGRRDEGGKS